MALHQNCHLIAVIGGKGGVGKSVFTANIALSFMNELRAKVLLIDMDARSCGDQNIILGLRPKKTVQEVAQFSQPISPASLESIVTPHPSGLHFIAAVSSPDQTLNAPSALFKKQLATLSQFYNFIFVDLGNEFGELQMGILEDAHAIMTVTTPEVLAVNQTKKVMQELMTATVPSEFFQLIINGMGRSSLDPKLISQTLGRPVVGLIPQDEVTTYGALQRSTPFMLTAPQSPIAQSYSEIVRKMTGGILQKLKLLSRPQSLKPKPVALAAAKNPQEALISSNTKKTRDGGRNKEPNPLNVLKMQIHTALIRELDLKKDLTNTKGDPQKEMELKNKTLKAISGLVDKMAPQSSREERSTIIKQVLDEALGLGPLEDLLADPTIKEIMVNGYDQIYVEKQGLQMSPVTFTSNEQLRNVITRIVEGLGRHIDIKTPYCDARLKDGSRVNAVIEPLAIDGPALTIRKFPADRITIDDYVNRFGSLTQPMAEFLKVCVEQGLNIIISGGTGTGKTTLLNVLSGFIPAKERIVTIEDAAELQLKQDHVVRLETRPAGIEGGGEITIRDLVKNSLRMRPDRIIVGECRDGAALDMLSAMNTGHDGSMTTVHSNNPREAISRLENLCLMAGMDLPAKAIREQIASAVHLIVQITRYSDDSRRISSITEVAGITNDTPTLQEIFRFKEEGFDKNRKVLGQFQAMGLIPTFIQKFDQRGIKIPRNLFTTNAPANSSPAPVPPMAPKKASGGNS